MMKSGFYNHRVLTVEIYEYDNGDENNIVIVTNDKFPSERVILTGAKARSLIKSLANQIQKVREGS